MGWKQHNRHYAFTQCIRWTYSDPFTPYFVLQLLTPTGVILHGDFGVLFKAVRGGAEEVETADSFAIKTNSTDLGIDNAPAINMKRANDWLRELSLLKEIYSAHGYTLKILGLSKAQCEPLRLLPANEEETNLSSEAEADDLFDVGQIIVETITGRPFFDVSDPAQRERKQQLRRFGPLEVGENPQQPGPSHRNVPSDPLNLENLLPSSEFPDRPSKRRTMDLVNGLTTNPKRRCSAAQALQIVPEIELPYPLLEEFHGRLEDLEHIDLLSTNACIQRINEIIKEMSGLLDDFVQQPHAE
ncbi:hypothetical protein M3Y99_01460000 [Aphelenchoides fujianensis]|nr:hypothetical protein M3Y99_01460000 [Aphelenchoides fujianensis]